MKRILIILILLVIVAGGLFWFLTRPEPPAAALAEASSPADILNGERVFWAGGCASCHARKGADGDERLRLAGGHRLETPFGVFVTPNITPDPETGIGDWDYAAFRHAMKAGVSPDGAHYYPAFPYASYIRMEDSDLRNLWAFMKTLPAINRPNEPHELALPFRLRRGIGLWKLLFLDEAPVLQVEGDNPELERGRYLVEALAHCGECHTPRNLAGGLDQGRWMAGGPSPEGKGKIPNITPHANGIESWSAQDIVYALKSGFTPEFDSFGGSMVSVQKNMAKLPDEDLNAIAAYLKAVPPVASD